MANRAPSQKVDQGTIDHGTQQHTDAHESSDQPQIESRLFPFIQVADHRETNHINSGAEKAIKECQEQV